MIKGNSSYRSKDVIWAIFLIFIGTIFLLNSTGAIGWGIWTIIFSFWPVILILAGLKLVLGRSALSDILLSIFALLVFLFVGAYSYLTYTSSTFDFLPNSVNRCIRDGCMFFSPRSQTVNSEDMYISEESYTGVESRFVTLNIGASTFEVGDVGVTEYIRVKSSYPENYADPVLASTLRNGRLEIDFRSASYRGFSRWADSPSSYDIQIGMVDIPTTFDIVLGAGEGVITLEEVLVENLSAKVGAGQLTINLGQQALASGSVTVEVGAGDVTLNLPSDTAYELDYELGIGQISSNRGDIASFVGSQKGYRSENYEDSELRVKIVAKVGVGSLIINSN